MLSVVALLAISPLFGGQAKPTGNYVADIEQWRTDYANNELLEPEGWLSVAGLFWLKPGLNTVGSDDDNTVILPARVSMPMAATLTLNGDSVTLDTIPGVDMTVDDKPATKMVLKSDMTGSPDTMRLGDVTFYIIQRGTRVGVRMFDSQCKARTSYKGLHWYPADEKWVVEAKFVPYNPPKSGSITNVLGDVSPTTFPGYLTFRVNGVDCRLDVEDAGDTFFINFQDATTGKTTYPAGRFLEGTAKPDKDGNVWLDFNKATCPPCAYTSFATCPLPPASNRLSVAITAGEKKYHE